MEKLDLKKWPETLDKWAEKSMLGRITRWPIIKEAIDLTGMAIGGVINGVRGSVESILKVGENRDDDERRMDEKAQQVGGSVQRVPKYQMPMNAQKLVGGKTVAGEIKVDSEGKLLNAVYLDKAPCKIFTRVKDASGNEVEKTYEKGEEINEVLEPVVTKIGDRARFRWLDKWKFHEYLTARTEGRESIGGPFGVLRLLAKLTKTTVKTAGSLATFGGVTAGAYGLLSAGLTQIGLPSVVGVSKVLLGNLLTHGLSVGAYTGLSATGVGLAVLAGGLSVYAGYKLAKGFAKLFPKAKPNLRYMAATTGKTIDEASMNPILSKQTHRTLAEHRLNGSTQQVTQDGDLVIHVDTTPRQLGLQTMDDRGRWITGFRDIDGVLHDANDVIPAGTVIPHETRWRQRGIIPPATEYQKIKSFTGSTFPVGAVKETVRIDNESGSMLQGMLTLRTGATLPFEYTDLQHGGGPVHYAAGEYSPPGSVIDVRILPKGTIIPAGSVVGYEVVSEGQLDINTMPGLVVTQSDVMLPHAMRLRRDVKLGIKDAGVLIPMDTNAEIIIAGEQFARTSYTVKTIEGREVEKDGKRYKIYQPKTQVLTAGSFFPAGTIIPARAKLNAHQAGQDNFPLSKRFENDIALGGNASLLLIATFLCNSGAEEHFRLRLGDDMVNTMGTFTDPETKRTYFLNQIIPAGTCIPARYPDGTAIEIPANTVIPGGSEIYDARTRKPAEGAVAQLRAPRLNNYVTRQQLVFFELSLQLTMRQRLTVLPASQMSQ